MDKYFYDFHYFFSRGDSGSYIVAFNNQLDINDEERCIEVAVEVGAIPEEYADNIDFIDELTEEEAREIISDDNIEIYEI